MVRDDEELETDWWIEDIGYLPRDTEPLMMNTDSCFDLSSAANFQEHVSWAQQTEEIRHLPESGLAVW